MEQRETLTHSEAPALVRQTADQKGICLSRERQRKTFSPVKELFGNPRKPDEPAELGDTPLQRWVPSTSGCPLLPPGTPGQQRFN